MRFTLPYNLYRFMGITGICLVIYIIVIGVFGNVDVSAYLPIKTATTIQKIWSELPFFSVEKEPTGNGNEQVTYFTVPTRQFTPQEIAEMKAEEKTATKPADSKRH